MPKKPTKPNPLAKALKALLPKSYGSPRKPKYSAKPVYRTPEGEFVTGEHPGPKRKAFDSKREFERWQVLRAMERAGSISYLQTQVPFRLHSGDGSKMATYRADFVYVENGRRVVEDCKGFRTPEYKRKKKWMLAEHGIEIRES